MDAFDGSVGGGQRLGGDDSAEEAKLFPVRRVTPVQVLIDLFEFDAGDDRIDISLVFGVHGWSVSATRARL